MEQLLKQLLDWATTIKNQTQIEGNSSTVVGSGLEKLIGAITDLQANKADVKALAELDKGLQNISVKFKGYKSSIAKLNTDIPNPENGWYAYVGETNTIWEVAGGKWANSSKAIPQELLDLGEYVRKEDLEDEYSVRRDTAPTSQLLNNLANKLYGSNEVLPPEETIPLTKGSNKSTTPSQWFYVNHAKLNGKYINTVKINIATAGKLSILYAKNVGKTGYTYDKDVFNVSAGINEIAIHRQLESDETIGFCDYDDTASFYYGASGSSNPVGGNFIQRNKDTGEWKSPTPSLDLTIGVYTGGATVNVKGDIKKIDSRISNIEAGVLAGKTFSVLGDSISSFEGKIPSDHIAFYPKYGIDNWQKTWWGLLTTPKYGMRLIANASYSGGTITGTDKYALPNYVAKLGDNPDYIFLFGGSNDYTYKKDIGKLTFDNADRNVFIQAVCYLIEETQKKYPNSIIIYLTPLQRNPSSATNGKYPNKVTDGTPFLYEYCDAIQLACRAYGVQVFDMYSCGIHHYNLAMYMPDLIHLNALGMEIVANYVYRSASIYI